MGFDLAVPPKFEANIREPLTRWLNGSMPLSEFLSGVEEQRILHYQYKNLPPTASVPSGSYDIGVRVALKLPSAASLETHRILFSINEDDVQEPYDRPLRLGI